MKKVAILMVLSLLVACNSKKEGRKYDPQERQSAFTSDAERQEAIDAKKAELDSLQLDLQTLIFDNNIKLTVLPPAAKGDITEAVSQNMAAKMMQITAQNGIGGCGNSPIFALATMWTPTGRSATGTAPQRMICKYRITYMVGNMLTGDVYATYEQEVSGAGASFEEAAMNAANEVKNTAELQQMLKTAQSRIMDWYNTTPQNFKTLVEHFVEERDYTTAFALLASVPKEATDCFAYAAKRQPQVLEQMKNQKAEDILADMRNAIAEAGEQYDPTVAGCMKLLPANSRQMAEAKKLFAYYEKHIRDTRMQQMKHEQKMELERMAAEREKLKYTQQASMKVAERAVSSPKRFSFSSPSSSSSGSSSGKFSSLKESVSEHPFLWGLGAGALATGVAGVALYASMPFLAKIGLALL